MMAATSQLERAQNASPTSGEVKLTAAGRRALRKSAVGVRFGDR